MSFLEDMIHAVQAPLKLIHSTRSQRRSLVESSPIPVAWDNGPRGSSKSQVIPDSGAGNPQRFSLSGTIPKVLVLKE